MKEHSRFLEALKLYGKDWKKVQSYVGTRSTTQARSHAQKHFAKTKKGLNSPKLESDTQTYTSINSPACKLETKSKNNNQNNQLLAAHDQRIGVKVRILEDETTKQLTLEKE